eukprot:scaffold12803_cov19-Tisochrysis_lutea.AAC.3
MLSRNVLPNDVDLKVHSDVHAAQPYLQELRALRHGHRDVFDDEAIRAEDKCVAFTPDNLTIDNMR